jgi:hypothetical protein
MIGNVSISVMILVIALIEKSYKIIWFLGILIFLSFLLLWEKKKDIKMAMKLIKITCSLLKEQSSVYFIAITSILINIIFSILWFTGFIACYAKT